MVARHVDGGGPLRPLRTLILVEAAVAGACNYDLPPSTVVPSPSEASHCPVAPLREVPLPHALAPEGAAGGSKGGGDGQARSDGQMPMQHALPEKVA